MKGLAPVAVMPATGVSAVYGERHALVASDAVNDRLHGRFAEVRDELVPLGRIPIDLKEFQADVMAFRLRLDRGRS